MFQFALLCFFVCIFLLSKNLDKLLWIVNLKEFSSFTKRGGLLLVYEIFENDNALKRQIEGCCDKNH